MKKNVIVTVLMIVIFVLGVALGGVCMMLYNNNKDKNDTSQLNNNTYNNGNDVASIGDNQGNNVVNNAFAVYQQNYNKMFNNSFSVDENGNLYDWVAYAYNNPIDSNDGISDAYVDSHGDAYIDISEKSNLYNKYGANYKVSSGVADIAFCHYANGLTYYLALVNQDGTVSVIIANDDTSTMSEIKVTNIPNINNIVKIIYQRYGNGWFGTAVDVNGNTINLDSYIDNILNTNQ
ncbi:MAG: hypothetical protein FWF46_05805 [Oscillospiraceae bacterium]|nr:hypothetical protein [Oscillospiraceae bacterium]